jgi:AcrR family transcriptional regulator
LTNNSLKYREKRQHIIKTAASAFSQKGFYRTVISDIARMAGIGKGVIYEYFPSKEELFFAVFEWMNEEMKQAARVGISALGETAAGRLRILNDVFVNAFTNMKDMYALTLEFWAAAADSPLRDRFQETFRTMYADYRQMVAGIIADGIRNGEFKRGADPTVVAAALVGSWDAWGLQAWLDPHFDLKTISHTFLDVVIEGL